uniref:Guanylate kinase 1 n=1 Tax=Oryza glumipatula TaxID=40148 RepID=A0A0E0BTD5_9ORYZ
MCKQGKSRFWSGVGNSASSPLPLTNDDQIHRIPAAASTSTPSPAPPHQIPPPIRSSPLLHRRRRRPPPASDPLLLGVSILGRVSRPPRGDQEAEDRGGATRIGGASALITAHFMGEEAPEFRVESVALESKDCLQNAIDIGDKTYVISRSDDPKSSITIKILDKLTQTWVVPTVLGAPPNPTSSHSAVLVNNEKILIIEKGVPLNDSIWFLEVDTPFVKQQSKIKGTVVVAWSKGVIGEGQKPIVISGPSGVGKGTLIAKLMKEYPSKFGFSVSHTTRAPREKEIDGVHYHFTERSKIEEEISEGKFLEFAHVHGNVYGTSIEAVESVTDEGKRCILDIDVQGARSVRASSLEAIFIFVCPPSFEELEKRLRARGTETEEQIQKRLRNARAELDQSNSPGLFDHLLVNDDLEACYENLKKLLSLDDDHEDSNDSFIKDGKETACYSILSKTNSEILLQSETNEAEKGTTNLISLDLSSLSGGAPGRTRGLKISPVN